MIKGLFTIPAHRKVHHNNNIIIVIMMMLSLVWNMSFCGCAVYCTLTLFYLHLVQFRYFLEFFSILIYLRYGLKSTIKLLIGLSSAPAQWNAAHF